MKAVKFYGVGDVRTEQIDIVTPADGQVLIKILYGGICGSDLHIWREGMFVAKTGETMGHEFIGTVQYAPADSGLAPGDLVVGDPRVPCGECSGCLTGDFHRCASLGFIGEVSPGGFAEYLVTFPQTLIKLAPGTDPVQGALAEPLAVAVHACHNIMMSGGDNALIVGAGPIGLLIACLLKHEYHLQQLAVADIDPFRRGKAHTAGADISVTSVTELTGQYDCIVDAVGLEITLNAALAAVRPGGCIYMSAIYEKPPAVDINLLVGGEITITGNNAYTFEDLQKAAAIIESGKLDLTWLITRILPAEEAAEAFRLLTAREKQDLKILLQFA